MVRQTTRQAFYKQSLITSNQLEKLPRNIYRLKKEYNLLLAHLEDGGIKPHDIHEAKRVSKMFKTLLEKPIYELAKPQPIQRMRLVSIIDNDMTKSMRQMFSQDSSNDVRGDLADALQSKRTDNFSIQERLDHLNKMYRANKGRNGVREDIAMAIDALARRGKKSVYKHAVAILKHIGKTSKTVYEVLSGPIRRAVLAKESPRKERKK